MNRCQETICWGCIKATQGGCSWMDLKQTVSGWKAVQTHHKCQNGMEYISYCVAECPGFKRG